MEVAETAELFRNRKHPYTHALLSAVPHPDPREKKQRMVLSGDVPSLINPPKGCIFCQRCPFAEERCMTEPPQLSDIGNGHLVACHRYRELELNR